MQLTNYTRYFWWAVLALVCIGAAWLALYGQRWLHVVAGLILACALFYFRKRYRLFYGLVEVAAGIATLWAAYPLVRQTCGTFAESCEPIAWYVVPLGTLVAIYIIIRGFDNVQQAWLLPRSNQR